MPWIWSALTILFITGAIQTIAEPGVSCRTSVQNQEILLMITVAITLVYEWTVKKDPNYWEQSVERRKMRHVLHGIARAGSVSRLPGA